MINFIMSLFLGMLPDVLYFTLFLKFAKGLKNDKNLLKLFLMLCIGYILLIMICRYQLLFYVAYIIWSYLALRIIYKSHIIDSFVYSISFSYLILLSYIISRIPLNYFILLVIDKIMLFVPFIFKDKIHKIYKTYISLWDRNDKQVRKIKSLTLRNISLIFINIMILILNVLVAMALLDFLKL